MSDIFISYARDDRDKAARLADILTRRGWSLWWDNDIPAGKTWADVIQSALDEARCVIVLWSSASRASLWVNAEAREGLRRRILIPIVLDEAIIPLEFSSIQAVSLTSWPDRDCEEEMQKLLTGVALMLGAKGEERASNPVAPRRQSWTPLDIGGRALTYFVSFLQLVAGPKAFLAKELEEPRRALKSATLFLFACYVFGFLLTAPLPSKSLLTDFFVGMAFVLSTVLVFGVAVYVSWRLVGAKAPLYEFLTIHFFCSGVLQLLEKVTFLTHWGLFRALSDPEWFARVQDTVFCKADVASFNRMLAGNTFMTVAAGLISAGGMLLGVLWLVAIWGAYRRINNLSRARSAIAALILAPLAIVAQGISYLVASALLSPQCSSP
jgi:hypothetical protein